MTDSNRPVNPTSIDLTGFSLSEIGAELRQAETYRTVGKNSRSLVKSRELSMVLMALDKGGELKEHHAPAPAAAVVLEGRVRFTAEGSERTLTKQDSVVFSSELPHSLVADDQSLLLLVIGGKS